MQNSHKISLRPPWSIFIITQNQKLFSRQTKAIGKLTKLSKTFMFTPKASPKHKRVKRHKNMKKVHCYWTTRLAGWHACRDEQMASKHCSLSRCSSPWRADYSPWQIVTDLCSGTTIFHPKNPIFIYPNPKFDRGLNLWWFYNPNIDYTGILWTFYTINNQFYFMT